LLQNLTAHFIFAA
jgi:hypothetical protein